jgi:hypothetical protein
MLTGPECYHLLGRSALSEDQKLAIDVFCAVNAGRTIPPSGGIGGAA